MPAFLGETASSAIPRLSDGRCGEALGLGCEQTWRLTLGLTNTIRRRHCSRIQIRPAVTRPARRIASSSSGNLVHDTVAQPADSHGLDFNDISGNEPARR